MATKTSSSAKKRKTSTKRRTGAASGMPAIRPKSFSSKAFKTHLQQHFQVLKGAKFERLERLQKELKISSQEVADIVLISPRTLSRRKKDGRLEPDEADRVMRIGRLFTQAKTLFNGDVDRTRHWFHSEYKALGGESPLSLARTDVGAIEVERFIGRLEHGVSM